MSAMVARRAILINLGANWLAPGRKAGERSGLESCRISIVEIIAHHLLPFGRALVVKGGWLLTRPTDLVKEACSSSGSSRFEKVK